MIFEWNNFTVPMFMETMVNTKLTPGEATACNMDKRRGLWVSSMRLKSSSGDDYDGIQTLLWDLLLVIHIPRVQTSGKISKSENTFFAGLIYHIGSRQIAKNYLSLHEPPVSILVCWSAPFLSHYVYSTLDAMVITLDSQIYKRRFPWVWPADLRSYK